MSIHEEILQKRVRSPCYTSAQKGLVLLPQTMLIQPAALTVRGVYRSLRSMAEQKGPGATARRKQTILHLLRSCRSALDASQQPTKT